MSDLNANYDEPWKDAIGYYFQRFLAFFPEFSAHYDAIDWERGFTSCEKELLQIYPEGESGNIRADKLFQVWLKNRQRSAALIFIHIEVQSQQEEEFAERMYEYNYRTFDKYRAPVFSLAVLGDRNNSWRPEEFGFALGDTFTALNDLSENRKA